MRIVKFINLFRLILVVSLVQVSGNVAAQVQRVSGTVTDTETGEALPGVTIILKGTTNGTITDLDGNYTLSVDSPDPVLVFSFVGYETQEVPLEGRSVVNLGLTLDIQALDEVVVIGYGTQKKSVVTGAIAKVDANVLKRSRDLRIEQALQGKAAGVMIMNNSGQPGDNLTIRIRGTGTNGDPDPLFIIDGLPMEKEGLDFLNSADVESIEVLKDAAAAAIYGARGANGVVLITTKQGKKGEKFTVTYDGFYGVQNPWRKLKMLNAEQYVNIINEAADNDDRTNPYFSQAMIDTLAWDTDWQEEMYYRNAPKVSHTVSFTGGSENGTYSSSLNYFSQDGIVAKGKSNFERITYRLNTTRELGNLKIGSNLNLVNINNRGIEGNSQFGTGIAQALNMPPIVPVRYNNGDWAVPNDFGIGLQEITNPIALLSYLHRETETYKALGNIYGEYEIIKGLKFRSNYGTELAFVNTSSYFPSYDLDATHRRVANGASKDWHKYIRWNWDNTLTYSTSIERHSMTFLVGMTRFKEWDEGLNGSKDSLIFNDLNHAYLNNSLQQRGAVSNSIGEHTLQSYFGRINYNFDEKYLFEGVLRIDGSSRFGSENKYGYFPAVSAGWVFSKESFFPTNGILDFAKIRASWGQNGNENIGNFQYTALMQGGLSYFFGDEQILYNGIQPDFYPNPTIRWETSEQLDIGLDMTLFSGKISMAFDYYNKRTKDWLISAPTLLLIGNNGPVVNGGEVLNKGFELELGYKSHLAKDFYLDVILTASTNRSEVVSINNASGSFTGGQGSVGMNDILRAEEGQPLGYFWGYKTEGIFVHPAEFELYPHQPNAKLGDLMFADINEDGTLDDSDRTNIGNPYPKFVTGLNTSLTWKFLDLSMFWYAAIGQDIWMSNRRNDLIYANYTTDILNRWQEGDETADYPRVTLNDPNQTWKRPSDFYVHDADFLRLKNITLGYTLPQNLLKSIGIAKLRIYATSENLLTLTKYPGMEVEVGGGPIDGIGIDHGVYPQSKTFLGGMNITF